MHLLRQMVVCRLKLVPVKKRSLQEGEMERLLIASGMYGHKRTISVIIVVKMVLS